VPLNEKERVLGRHLNGAKGGKHLAKPSSIPAQEKRGWGETSPGGEIKTGREEKP